MQSMALGAKTAQRLMNSDRGTHLYCSFFTVLFFYAFRVSFKFLHSKLHKIPSIFISSIKYAVAIGTAPVPELLFSMGTVIYRACVFPKIQSF